MSSNSEMVQDRAVLTMADPTEIHGNSIISDLERPLIHISRSRHYLTVRDTDTVTVNSTNKDLRPFR